MATCPADVVDVVLSGGSILLDQFAHIPASMRILILVDHVLQVRVVVRLKHDFLALAYLVPVVLRSFQSLELYYLRLIQQAVVHILHGLHCVAQLVLVALLLGGDVLLEDVIFLLQSLTRGELSVVPAVARRLLVDSGFLGRVVNVRHERYLRPCNAVPSALIARLLDSPGLIHLIAGF